MSRKFLLRRVLIANEVLHTGEDLAMCQVFLCFYVVYYPFGQVPSFQPYYNPT